ncbi:GNAT family N-acetyltransferase [Cognataquiflexum rubidum]|uniref:GNAT family N-acetyltransferase n=1 Tax=Cognataquiflexum rubidum TaxID=2922273 RepID=UPI001F1390B1|nr:GNAT family N-acetyltransferase [Cognataquiflexum rubidum]MCH6235532.1 GNAT family N-acetyltransferase [Cognataquiflexum rubidum]
MLKIETLTSKDQATFLQKKEISEFLFVQLEQYGDPIDHILKCLDYALNQAEDKGGFVVMAREAGEIAGAVVVNKTGMSGYIPENILVYIAVDASQRGKGVGKTLMQTVIDFAQGDIALHVEPDNPAKKLYEKLGFSNKYLEMRLKK